jgi:alkanesulfonate monooxygenase SsuD/methylene tetrahydromethanopterin reductase-like flavin-dependent oxidoreductase (luciferase family)
VCAALSIQIVMSECHTNVSLQTPFGGVSHKSQAELHAERHSSARQHAGERPGAGSRPETPPPRRSRRTTPTRAKKRALLLASSMQQAFVNLRTGRPGQLPPPLDGYANQLPPAARAMLDDVLSCSAIGSPQTVRESLVAFGARTGPQELMITSQIFDHTARLHSYKITAQVRDQL